MKTKTHDHDKKHDHDRLPKPGGKTKFNNPDRRKDKDDQKSKGNGATNTTDRVKQGRWRTVATEKVPANQLTQPEDTDYVEHRPLGF